MCGGCVTAELRRSVIVFDLFTIQIRLTSTDAGQRFVRLSSEKKTLVNVGKQFVQSLNGFFVRPRVFVPELNLHLDSKRDICPILNLKNLRDDVSQILDRGWRQFGTRNYSFRVWLTYVEAGSRSANVES